MLVLAIDTATSAMVTGLVDESGLVAQRVVHDSRAHNEALVPSIQECLAEAGKDFSDLTAVVAGVGPGPFTSLRVGMVTAQAIGQARGIPVHGVCTHDALARKVEGVSVLVVTDARRREVYWSGYEGARRVGGPDVCPPVDLDYQAEVLAVAGPEDFGAKLDKVQAQRRVYDVELDALALVQAADLDAESQPLVPLYLRRPDAVAPKLQVSPAIPKVNL